MAVAIEVEAGRLTLPLPTCTGSKRRDGQPRPTYGKLRKPEGAGLVASTWDLGIRARPAASTS